MALARSVGSDIYRVIVGLDRWQQGVEPPQGLVGETRKAYPLVQGIDGSGTRAIAIRAC